MTNVLPWLLAHWPVILPVLVLILNDLRNGLTAYPKVETIVDVVGDLISVHQKSDSPGTFKLPFVRSTNPNAISQPTPPPVPAAVWLPFLLVPAIFVVTCAHFPPPSPSVMQYRAAFGACMAGKGITVAENDGDHILQILEAGGFSAGQLEQQIEGLAIATAGQGIQDIAVCAVTSWFAANPVSPNIKPTPSQGAARLYLLKHVPAGPGVHR